MTRTRFLLLPMIFAAGIVLLLLGTAQNAAAIGVNVTVDAGPAHVSVGGGDYGYIGGHRYYYPPTAVAVARPRYVAPAPVVVAPPRGVQVIVAPPRVHAPVIVAPAPYRSHYYYAPPVYRRR